KAAFRALATQGTIGSPSAEMPLNSHQIFNRGRWWPPFQVARLPPGQRTRPCLLEQLRQRDDLRRGNRRASQPDLWAAPADVLREWECQLLRLILGLITITAHVAPHSLDLRPMTGGRSDRERDGRAIVRNPTPSEQHLLDRLERALARFRTDDPATVALPVNRVETTQI